MMTMDIKLKFNVIYMSSMFIAAEKRQNLKKEKIYFLLKLFVRVLKFRNGTYLPSENEKERHISLVLTFFYTKWIRSHSGIRIDSCPTRRLIQTKCSEVTQQYQINLTNMYFGFS
jgi:regulator of sirC expression with transglutaminase-like and TPR domain